MWTEKLNIKFNAARGIWPMIATMIEAIGPS